MFFFLQESFYFRRELLFCCPWGPREWEQGSFKPKVPFQPKSIQNKKIKTKNLILITTITFTQTQGTLELIIWNKIRFNWTSLINGYNFHSNPRDPWTWPNQQKKTKCSFFFMKASILPLAGARLWSQEYRYPLVVLTFSVFSQTKRPVQVKSIQNKKIETKNLI
jgi:hypothetical protein